MKRITFVLSVLILTVLMAFQGLVLLGQEDGREKAPVKPRSFQPATYDEKDVGGHGRSFEAWFNSTVGSSLVPAGCDGYRVGREADLQSRKWGRNPDPIRYRLPLQNIYGRHDPGP